MHYANLPPLSSSFWECEWTMLFVASLCGYLHEVKKDIFPKSMNFLRAWSLVPFLLLVAILWIHLALSPNLLLSRFPHVNFCVSVSGRQSATASQWSETKCCPAMQPGPLRPSWPTWPYSASLWLKLVLTPPALNGYFRWYITSLLTLHGPGEWISHPLG